ncbi:low molecular weight phosphotyrosine phosphatase family protein [Burkholderia cepacia]|uniref:protein-tyrosine-phosphatase n=2 Tax=Burkholderiaceae TaxID=119060 RepID=A0AA89CFY2_BURCE|nr:low molecular weight phosphotyrosine phosphatase family protein [Burkholderia cepacia]
MRHQVDAAALADRIAIDSAGTGDWHVGEPPDSRAQAAARSRGYDLSALRARQVSAADFERFDLLLAMDEANLAELRRRCPPQHRDKVRLLMEFAPGATETEVADPYFGGAQGFERVLDQVERACAGLLETLRARTAR